MEKHNILRFSEVFTPKISFMYYLLTSSLILKLDWNLGFT